MYETFVRPNFGKQRISNLKKSDVKRFYNYLDYFVKGLKISELLGALNDYRIEVYDTDIPDEVFYVDIFIATIKISIRNSSWILLPKYSRLLPDEWDSYLSKKNSVKILWAAQKLIGEQGVLAGENAVVQLPTGVGKTKSIELIIRSAFLSKRATKGA